MTHRNLWCAVIHQAIDDLDDKRPEVRLSAVEFMSDPHSSLSVICRMIGLPEDTIRRRCRAIRARVS